MSTYRDWPKPWVHVDTPSIASFAPNETSGGTYPKSDSIAWSTAEVASGWTSETVSPHPAVDGEVGFFVVGDWCDRCGDQNYDETTRACLTCTFPDHPCSRAYLDARGDA